MFRILRRPWLHSSQNPLHWIRWQIFEEIQYTSRQLLGQLREAVIMSKKRCSTMYYKEIGCWHNKTLKRKQHFRCRQRLNFSQQNNHKFKKIENMQTKSFHRFNSSILRVAFSPVRLSLSLSYGKPVQAVN